MARQKRLGIASLAAALVLGGVAGCSAQDADKSPGVGDPKPSPTRSGATGGAPEADGTLPGVPTAEQARAQLSGLKVAPHGSMSGYSRDRFPHWASQGKNCNSRETVLNRDGTNVKRDAECRAVSGAWVSVYDDLTFKDAADLDIDHTVPLANAWRSGANRWTQEKRKEFANDLTHPQLLAVSAASNRSKGDQGPDEWQPPSKTYWCTYGRAWTSVKATYELSVTVAEKDMLGQMLDTCSS
ncbi:HNH endonuclease [Streptomyces sp. R302]|uniref:HNH endonuclease family protein n=1 Tax=unclassified Streptomyces TaxID=2593676 RepID=UPI00145F8EC4|nr:MULTISPECIES: HNH endonuclease family protein [unclassified Streptomyces]NML55510.1 HNH endonuclease [Streptomyces sp. R301]NML83941.1 HNH endonuclease [Streptomyces sp. R302]